MNASNLTLHLAFRISRLGPAIAILAIALIGPSGASALEVPFLAGRVNDQANLLDSAFEDGLEERLRLLEEETGAHHPESRGRSARRFFDAGRGDLEVGPS